MKIYCSNARLSVSCLDGDDTVAALFTVSGEITRGLTDGWWIVTMGEFGIVGFLAQFGSAGATRILCGACSAFCGVD